MGKELRGRKYNSVHGINGMCHDSKETIDKCLTCVKDECDNCVDGGKQNSIGRPSKVDMELFATLVRAGVSKKEICEEFGIGSSTYQDYKRRLTNESK